jgi:hypothetical protein
MVNFPPTVILSRRVNSLVGVSSWRLQREFLDLARHNLVCQTPVVLVILR